MACSAFETLFVRAGTRPARLSPPGLVIDTKPPAPEPILPVDWTAARVTVNDQLWGAGYILPGGETEVVHLAKPFGISSAGSLLLVGVGSGGPASAIVRNLGAWVTGQEADPSLLEAAQQRVVQDRLGRRIKLGSWDPQEPVFNERTYNHCLALEPLRRGQPEPILHALSRAVGPGGHIVITGVAADTSLDPDDETVAAWACMENRTAKSIPTAMGVARMLGRVGFDVRVVEDITRRHLEQAVLGWRLLLNQVREAAPDRDTAKHILREAELWVLRRRLMRGQRIKMVRWHAISQRMSARPI